MCQDTADVDSVLLKTIADELAEGVIANDSAELGRNTEPRGGTREYRGRAAWERAHGLSDLVERGIATEPQEFSEHFADH
jgi:hypothetical protein